MDFLAKTLNVADDKTILNYSIYKCIDGNPIIKNEQMACARFVQNVCKQPNV